MLEPEATNDNIWRICIACWMKKSLHERKHVHTHMPRVCAREHTHTHTHTHTHMEKYVILIAFPWQQWCRERASMLRYKYIGCLVKT